MQLKYNDKIYEVHEGQTYGEVLKEEIQNHGEHEYIAGRYNNSIVSFNSEIRTDGEFKFIDRTDKDGRIIYIRGLIYIMSKAFNEVYPDALLTVNYLTHQKKSVSLKMKQAFLFCIKI